MRKFHGDPGLPQKKRKISNNLSLPKGTRERRTNPKVSGRKGIIKIRSEINEIGTKNKFEKINESKSWLFEKIHKINKVNKKQRAQRSKIRNKREIATDTTEIQNIIRGYYEQLEQ